jgi:hypothetical protein
MKVRFICGYYSDRAKTLSPRPEIYWDAYFFVWIVKTGEFKRSFYIHRKDGTSVQITRGNKGVPRQLFGTWIGHQASVLGEGASLVPVPSKDGVVGASSYRSLEMVREALRGTPLAALAHDALRWTEALPKAHEGGPRRRAELLMYLKATDVRGRRVILVDDLLSTGGSLLACRDTLETAGAEVLGALTCGRTIYDFDTKPFGTQEIDLVEELADWHG